jgi:hypothetical protein
MKYTVGMGTSAITCIPSFIKTGSGIDKLIVGAGGVADTQSAW